MKQNLPLALFGAILFAGCDTTTTQASTSSETQTALQALADNARTNPALAKTTGPANVAARRLASADSCVGAEWTWIRDGDWQEEILPPIAVWDTHDTGAAWLARRVGLATNQAGLAKSCGDGGYFQIQWHQEVLEKTGLHSWGSGIVSGADQTRGLDRFEYDLTNTFPTGFQISFHEIDSTPQPGSGWFNYASFTVLESFFLFGNGRYRIPIATVPDTSKIPYFTCNPITDLRDGAKTVGFFCSNFEGDSTVILDATSRRIPGNLLAPHPVVDSMGLSNLSLVLDADSLRLSLRVQVPTAPGFSQAQTRLCLRCSDSGMTTVGPWVMDLPPGQAEMGTHVYWSVPASAFDTSSATVSILRRYPDWRSQIAHSPDSLSGWWIVSTALLPITSAR